MVPNEYDEIVGNMSPGPEVSDGASPYDAIVADDHAAQQSMLKQSMAVASETQPDYKAKAIELARQADLPVETVERNFDMVSKKQVIAANDYDKIITDTPGLAKWLEDPNNSGIGHDDIPAMSKVEDGVQEHSMLSSMYSALGSGMASLYAGVARVPAAVQQIGALPQNLLVKAVGPFGPFTQQVGAPEWLINNPIAKYYDAAADQYRPPEMHESVTANIKDGNYAKAGRTLAVQFTANAPQQAALIASYMSGYGIAGLVSAGVLTGTQELQQAQEAGVEPAMATTSSIAKGTIESGFESLGTFGILKSWESSIAKQYGKETSKQVIGDFVKTIAHSVAGEGNEEFLTSAAQDMTDYITGVNPDALHGILQRATDAGLIGAASGGLMTGPAALQVGHARVAQSRQANLNRDFYLALGNDVEATKIKKRLPESIKSMVDSMTAGGPVEHIFMPLEAVETYFQSKDQSAAKIMQDLGVSKEYNEAKETGADIKIPLSTWAEKIVGTEYYQGLADDVKFNPAEFTVNEAKTEFKKIRDEMVQAAESAKPTAENVASAESAAQVGESVAEQLKAAGMDEKQAFLYEKVFGTLAKRTGVSPKELFDSYNLRINRGMGQAPLQPQAPRAVFLGYQEGIDNFFPLFNVEGDHPLNGSTVSGDTLQKRGIAVPEIPSYDEWSKLPKARTLFQDRVQGPPAAKFIGYQEGIPGTAPLALYNIEGEHPNTGSTVSANELKNQGIDVPATESFEDWQKNAAMPAPAIGEGAPSKFNVEYLENDDSLSIKSKDVVASGEFSHDAETYINEWLNPEGAGYKKIDIEKAGLDKFERPFTITDIQVSEKSRRSGIGTDAMKAIESAAIARGADVILLNASPMGTLDKSVALPGLIKFYKSLGYKVIRKSSGNAEMFKAITKIMRQTDEGGRRGQIQFGPRGIIISLLEKADLSTFLHETGHFFLEVLGDLAQAESAPQDIKDDYAKALKWLGVESRDQIKTEQHEQWAKGFEAYLMEGKAPSNDLRQLFARFKIWLTKTYKVLTSLNVTLTDDVRNVFDRMIASEEEIAAAKGEMNIHPLFTDPSSFGMTGEKGERYMKAVADANLSAEEQLTARLMADYQRQQNAWYKEEKAKLAEPIRKELQQQNRYKALSILQTGLMPDRSPLPDGTEAIKLSKPDIIKEYGKDYVKTLPKKITTAKDGVNHNVAAEMFGFESGDILLTTLANLLPLEEQVSATADQQMKEKYPDMLTSGELHDEALKTVHNEKRGQLLRMELEHLAANNMPVLKDVIRRTARRVPTEKMVRDQAISIIGATTVKEIKPYLYQRAEIKAAKQAGELLAKGDFAGAYEAKRRELLNYELYRASVDANESMEKSLERFKRIARSDEKLVKSRDIDLVNAARAVLAQFGIGKPDKPAMSYLEQIKRYDPDTYGEVIAIVASASEGAGPYETIKYDDFVAMQDAVDAIWDLAKSTKEFDTGEQKMDSDQVKEKLGERLTEITKPGNRAGYDRAANQWDKVKMGLLGIKAALTRAEAWAAAIDGDESDVFTRYIVRPVLMATARYREQKKIYINKFLQIIKPIEKTLVLKDIKAPELGYTFSGRAELLGAVVHIGNKSNLSKLLRGRGWGEFNADGSLNTAKWDKFISRMWQEGVLTKRDHDVVQEIWNLHEELKPGAQKAHKKMYGSYFNEITADEVVTPFGTYRGGYVPARADPFLAQDQAIRDEREQLEKQNNSFMFPTAGRGFTKARVSQYAAPLIMDLKQVPGHIDKVLRFIEIEPHVKSVSRLLWAKDFRRQLDAFDPTVAGDMLVPWLQRSAQQMIQTPMKGWGGKAADTFFRELRTRTGLQIMTANVVNTLQQFTGLSIAAVKVRPKYLRNALWTYVRTPKQTVDDISEKSIFMRNRVTSQVMEIQQTIDDLLLNPNKYEKARDFAKRHGYFLQSGTQNIVDVITWSGAYNQAVAEKQSESDAVQSADAAVRLTQGSFNPEDVSRFETGTALARAFTMFYSYFNMQHNLLGSESAKVSRGVGLKKGAGRLLYVYTFGFIIVAVLNELLVKSMSGHFDEDDDDEYLDDVMSAFFMGPLRSATALFPIVGPTVQAGINKFNDKWYDDRISTSPAVSMIESAVSVPSDVYHAITGDARRKPLIRDTLTLLGLMSGLPLAPLSRPLGYLSDVSEGTAQPEGAIDFTRGLITGKSGAR